MPEQQENQTEVFHLKAPFKPTGDQPQAIEALVQGLKAGDKGQTLLGVTGSGKTFTMANIIAQCNRPTLILEPNKTLASQICTEMRGFFPDDAVEYFVSYYDYYQPEAYIASSDTYIEKDASINDEIDRLRHPVDRRYRVVGHPVGHGTGLHLVLDLREDLIKRGGQTG